MGQYIERALSSFSMMLNAVLLNGNPAETISGRCHREDRKLAEAVINTLFFWDVEHCYECYINDRLWARSLLNA